MQETESILKNRAQYAFQKEVLDEETFNLILEKTYSLKDIRTGLFLLKEAAEISESKSKRKITIEEAKEAIEKLKNFKIKDSSNLEETEKEILELIKENPEKTTKELFEIYNKEISYTTFFRKIENLQKSKQISKDKKLGKNIFSYGTLK
jgi:Cdc6-like AAA superfamily ATPase